MGAATGIAGSARAEQHAVFLCEDEWEVDWFTRMNNTGGPLDVSGVDGVDLDALVESPEGYKYLPGTIEPHRLILLRRDVIGQPFPRLG